MISKTLSRKTLAAFLSVAVLSVYSMIALASPEAKVAIWRAFDFRSGYG